MTRFMLRKFLLLLAALALPAQAQSQAWAWDDGTVPYVRTSGDLSNRTDVFAQPMRSLPFAASSSTHTYRIHAVARDHTDPTTRQRVHDAIVRAMEHRMPGWWQRWNRSQSAH